jgi:hypothetical protein
MYRFTLDSATEFLCGTCVNILSAPLEYPHFVTAAVEPNAFHGGAQWSAAFFAVQEQLGIRLRRGGLWPLWEFFQDRTEPHMKIITALLDPIIEEAIQKKESQAPKKDGEKDIDDDSTLLGHLVNMTSGM